MYLLRFTPTFIPAYKVLIKGKKELERRTEKALRLLKTDPFYPSLKSHRVNTRNFGPKWSSWITGDLRIIWDFDKKDKHVIILLIIAKHSGAHKEYK